MDVPADAGGNRLVAAPPGGAGSAPMTTEAPGQGVEGTSLLALGMAVIVMLAVLVSPDAGPPVPGTRPESPAADVRGTA